MGGAAGCDGVFLSQDLHACLVLMISSCIQGQNTAVAALLVILVTPWCAEWSVSRASLRRLVGRTVLSL